MKSDDIYVDQWMGVLPKEDFTIKIYCKEMSVGKALKKEILDSMRFFDKLKGMNFMESNNFIVPMETVMKYIDELKEKSDKWDNVLRLKNIKSTQTSDIELEQENKVLKEELGKVLADSHCTNHHLFEIENENQKNKEIVDKVKDMLHNTWAKTDERKIQAIKEILGESG